MNIFVGNLSFDASEEDLARLFAPYGKVTSARIPRRADTDGPMGFGFVRLASPDGARRAMKELNGTLLKGREIVLEEARKRSNDVQSGRSIRPSNESPGISAAAPAVSAPPVFRRVVAGTLAYVVLVFPLAVLWHVTIFSSVYERFGYFDGGPPNFGLGFLSILLQGVVLAAGHALWVRPPATMKDAFRFSYGAGFFLWTCHVVAHAAKHPLSSDGLFFAMETAYLFIQFTLFGWVLGVLGGRASKTTGRA